MSCHNCVYYNSKTYWCKYWHMRMNVGDMCSGYILKCPSCGGRVE